MTKQLKILFILALIIAVTSLVVTPKVFAAEMISHMIDSGDSFLEAGADDAIQQSNLAEVSRNIYYPFLGVAIAIAVFVGAYLGIKIMVATVEEKAKIKEMLIPYLVGVVVIFSVFLIWSTVVKIGTSVVGSGYSGSGSAPTIQTGRINRPNTKIYVSADETSDVVITLNQGSTVKVVSQQDPWYKITYTFKDHGITETFSGYVKAECVTIY